ncbi:MAG: single-stranded-DNA-specific exonuclease RecJ [Candidatus Peribacteraceae bacterium]|nr:single-stranded-DNA-specific exonuclease RecJ [Candidatus Peribacteraceae bacterium]MDD5739974.1 single-stranded-DNA-specific exonuclease RecJ [Candidatus Peribacteraceae bacterium]
MQNPLSLTGKRWSIPEQTSAMPSAILARLFSERQLAGHTLPPPQIFPDMSRAVERVHRAIAAQETIGIFGDYDCDGITATALLVRFLRRHGTEPIVRLPHRVRDGYGLNQAIVEECAERGITLLLTVDTGITAAREVAAASARGIDVIVTDHHHVPSEAPQALALIHPALAPNHPLPHPSGVGVALQFVRALEETDEWNDHQTDLALAAIGTIADMVELRGMNRTLVQRGIAALNTLKEGPLALLALSVRTQDRPLTSTDIAFRLSPRINAAGRMDDPLIALRALLEGGDALAMLEQLNEHRQDTAGDLFTHAWQLLNLSPQPRPEELSALPALLAVTDTEFPEGLIGLIAGRLTEATGHPSIVTTIRDECTASLRSTRAYHVTEGLERIADLLSSFGGHAQAAGCTFPKQHLSEVIRRLSEDVAARTSRGDLTPSLTADATINAKDISLSFCEQMKHLEPYGQGNFEPLFLLQNVSLEQTRRVGNEGTHLQCRIAGLKTIGWRLGHLIESAAAPLDVVCKIGIDTWNGRRAPQIVLEDMRLTLLQTSMPHPGTGAAPVNHTGANAPSI